ARADGQCRRGLSHQPGAAPGARRRACHPRPAPAGAARPGARPDQRRQRRRRGGRRDRIGRGDRRQRTAGGAGNLAIGQAGRRPRRAGPLGAHRPGARPAARLRGCHGGYEGLCREARTPLARALTETLGASGPAAALGRAFPLQARIVPLQSSHMERGNLMAKRAEQAGQVLDLAAVLNDLVADGLLERRAANGIGGEARSREQSLMHPLAYIASLRVESARQPGRTLDGQVLAQWLADRAGLPLWHIDPLKINVPAVTAVMSFEFARRHQILCVEAGKDEVVIATAQPFVTSWVEGLEQASRRRVKRVVVNPAELQKYMVEFY